MAIQRQLQAGKVVAAAVAAAMAMATQEKQLWADFVKLVAYGVP